VIDEADRRWVSSMPDAYERLLVPTVFRPFAVDLTERVVARGPNRILELAAGTGVLTAELRSRLNAAEIVATDLNASMVEFGRNRVPAVSWQEADAMKLPFHAAEFDVVACQFGVMFFPDKRAAYAETRRVLRPGGAFVFNSWASVSEHQFEDAFVAALGRMFPHDPPTFLASVPHGYADPDVIVTDLEAGGFDRVQLETITLDGRAESAADLAMGYCTGTPVRAEIVARGDLDGTAAAVAAEMERVFGSGPVVIRMTAHRVEAA
jgi:SAM-dependent methyltransferase